jgi:hypothetical protein
MPAVTRRRSAATVPALLAATVVQMCGLSLDGKTVFLQRRSKGIARCRGFADWSAWRGYGIMGAASELRSSLSPVAL